MYSVSSAEAAKTFSPELERSERLEVQRSIERIWAGCSCDFVRCDHCGFGFADPLVAATSEFYAALYGTTEAYSECKWEFVRTIAALRELLLRWGTSDVTLVDVGAGAGAFASYVSGAFSDHVTILCTEYSESGQNAIRTRGFDCLAGGLMDLDPGVHASGFDVLCLFQVLEHIDDVDSAFGRLSVLATDRAHMFVAVPNHRRRGYFDALGLHEDMPPVHVGRWSRRSLEIMADKHGWKLVEDGIEPEPFASRVRRLAFQFYLADPRVQRLGRVRQRTLRRALRGGLVAFHLLRSARAVLGLVGRDLGSNYWVHLSREDV